MEKVISNDDWNIFHCGLWLLYYEEKIAFNKSPVNVATPISRVKCHRSSFNHNCWRPYKYRLSRCVRASIGCVVELFNPNYEHDSTAIGVATIHHPPHRPGSSYQNHKQTPNIQTTNRKPAAAPISIVWREKKKKFCVRFAHAIAALIGKWHHSAHCVCRRRRSQTIINNSKCCLKCCTNYYLLLCAIISFIFVFITISHIQGSDTRSAWSSEKSVSYF